MKLITIVLEERSIVLAMSLNRDKSPRIELEMAFTIRIRLLALEVAQSAILGMGPSHHISLFDAVSLFGEHKAIFWQTCETNDCIFYS